MPKAPPAEKATFTIVGLDGVAVSFKVAGSVVGAIVEAFTWLHPDRRVRLLERLNAKHAQMLSKEAERNSATTAVSP